METLESLSNVAGQNDQAVIEINRAVRVGTKTREQGMDYLRGIIEGKAAVRKETLDRYPAPSASVMHSPTAPRIEMGRNEHHNAFIRAATDAILVRDGVLDPRKADNNAGELAGESISDLARTCLNNAGITPPPREKKFQCVTAGIDMRRTRGYSTSDFTALTENIGAKAASLGCDNAPETWMHWTRQTTTPSFLAGTRVTSPDMPAPPLVHPNGQIQEAALGSDFKEGFQVQTYAETITISREALVNDDTQRLTVTAEAAGRAASRLVGNLAYAVLTDNAALNDGIALFHANHSNLVGSGSGAAPSVATLNAMKASMASQTLSGEVLNIRPYYLLVPVALESTANVLILAQYGNGQDNAMPAMQVISDARLDAFLDTGWYGVANPARHSTVDIVTLEGARGRPQFEQFGRFSRDGLSFRILHDVAAVAVDYRTVSYNYGA